MTVNAGFTGTKTSSNSSFSLLNPSLTAALNFSVTQPLFRGCGVFLNRAPILIARINRQVARDRFEQSLTATLQSVQNQYWDTVNARETLVVARNSLELAETFYKRDKRSLELGALPPLDIFRSEADVANRKVAVTSAEYQLKEQEDALRRLISADIDPDVRALPLELTDAPATTDVAFPAPEEAVQVSFRKRPELTQLHRQQTIYETSERVSLNELKPNMSLAANYSSNGLGGDNLITGVLVPGGFNDALRQTFGFGSPTYGFTVSLSLPLRNHQAAADVVDSEINLKRNIYSQRSLEQQIALDVRTALNSLEQSRLNIVGAISARDLAKKTVEAEQRKYELGSGQVNFVLDAQQRLTDAENQLLQAMIGYRKAVISVQRATGTLLDENHLVLQQAIGG
jgi:outer membrane protein